MDFKEKLRTDYYRGKCKYPNKSQFIIKQCPKCEAHFGTVNFCYNCGTNVKKQREAGQKEYEKQLKVYKDEQKRLANEFYDDIIEEVGLTDHLKAEKVFGLAWEYGHSAGHHEVYYYMDDLAELVK